MPVYAPTPYLAEIRQAGISEPLLLLQAVRRPKLGWLLTFAVIDSVLRWSILSGSLPGSIGCGTTVLGGIYATTDLVPAFVRTVQTMA